MSITITQYWCWNPQLWCLFDFLMQSDVGLPACLVQQRGQQYSLQQLPTTAACTVTACMSTQDLQIRNQLCSE